MRLCEPTRDVINLVKQHSYPIVEIGAGDGYWLKKFREHGIECIGYDIFPRDACVLKGNHKDAARTNHSLLAVWPPDGKIIQSWVKAANWPVIFLAAHFMRIDLDDSLLNYKLEHELTLPRGFKGVETSFRVYRIIK